MLSEGTINSINDTRTKYGLTMKQVSDLTGVPYRTVQNWCLGVRTPKPYVVNMVVKIIEDSQKNAP